MDPGVLKQIAMGTAPPGVAAAMVFALLWWRGQAGRWRQVAGALALAGLYAGFHAWLFGDLDLPPKSSADWLVVAALTAAVSAAAIGLVHHDPRTERVMRPPLRLVAAGLLGVLAIVAIGRIAAGTSAKNWSVGETAASLGGFVGLACLAVFGAEFVAQRRRGFIGPLVLLIFASGAALVLVTAFSSLKLSQSAGLWAAFAGGALVVSLFRRGVSLAGGVAALSAVMAMAALYQGVLYTYTSRPWLYLGLLTLSPLLAAVGSLPRAQGRGAKAMALLPVVLALAPVLAAAGLALAQQESSEYGY